MDKEYLNSTEILKINVLLDELLTPNIPITYKLCIETRIEELKRVSQN